MITRMVVLALVAGLVYLHATNPTELDHQEAILALLEPAWPLSEELQDEIWRTVDYSNFLVCSFMKTSADSKMITTGYLHRIELVNNRWLQETRQNLQKTLAY